MHVTLLSTPPFLVITVTGTTNREQQEAIEAALESATVAVWQASPFTREEGSGVMPLRDLF